MDNEIYAKSLLIKHKHPDSWFITSYGMNLYRGCSHDCIYCDGRSEKYRIEGDFCDAKIKINAAEVLKKELDPARKRKPFIKGFILPGGGVGDVYQKAEEKYQLTREILKVILDYGLPVHILTKSVLVERDIDIISEINRRSRAIVSFSLSSSNDNISSYFEPGASPASERLKAVNFFRQKGIHSGIFLMPLIPYITDTEDILSRTIHDVKQAGADYMVTGGMTLKSGRQKDLFYEHLKKSKRNLIEKYDRIYPPDKYGSPSSNYINAKTAAFNRLTENLNIPKRIPVSIFRDILAPKEMCAVVLEQLYFFYKNRNISSSFGQAAWKLRKINPDSVNIPELSSLNGIDNLSISVIKEIAETGTSELYEEMLIK
ncbi:MAG: radical SAM protein [Spirochaetes bacterium]|nr:radical SAM protein [Spirochaetota bacterium]